MTAEAWVCRQFLGVGGPGPASTEAAELPAQAHGPTEGAYNLYYWYYGTLAMYQHGGDAWSRWNAARPRPDRPAASTTAATSPEAGTPTIASTAAKGGRIYCTALATSDARSLLPLSSASTTTPSSPPPSPPPEPAPSAAANRPRPPRRGRRGEEGLATARTTSTRIVPMRNFRRGSDTGTSFKARTTVSGSGRRLGLDPAAVPCRGKYRWVWTRPTPLPPSASSR